MLILINKLNKMIFLNVMIFFAHIALVSALSYIIYKSTMYYLDDQESYSQLTKELLIKKIEILLKTNSINYKLVYNNLKITYLCKKSYLDDNINIPFAIIINSNNNEKGVFDIRINYYKSNSKYLKFINDIVQLLSQIKEIVHEYNK